MKHTPGPWKWTSISDGYFFKLLNPEGICVIDDGSACGEYAGIDTDSPDARLIAAAPELLEALTALLDANRRLDVLPHADHFDGVAELARAENLARVAITKATEGK